MFRLLQDKLFPYAEENVKGFLESHWDSEEVKEAVAALHKQATEDQEKNVEGLVAVPSKVKLFIALMAVRTSGRQSRKEAAQFQG